MTLDIMINKEVYRNMIEFEVKVKTNNDKIITVPVHAFSWDHAKYMMERGRVKTISVVPKQKQ